MLTFKNTNLIFIILLIILSALRIFGYISAELFVWYFIPATIIVYSLILFFGSYFISSGFYMSAYCRKNTNKKEIAITFDDGPDRDVSPEILDVLAEHDIKAGFFLIGKNILGNEKIVQRIHDDGHMIGNHSYSHSHLFDFFPTRKMVNDLKKCDDHIINVINKKVKMFRPPFGVTNPTVKKASEKLGYHVIGWSVRSFDTTKINKKKVLERVAAKLNNGDIVLFHDKGNRISEILKLFVKYCNDHDFKFVRPDKLLELNAYE